MIQIPTETMSEINPKMTNAYPSYMVNITQGRAHHNTYQNTQASSPPLSQEDEQMKS